MEMMSQTEDAITRPAPQELLAPLEGDTPVHAMIIGFGAAGIGFPGRRFDITVHKSRPGAFYWSYEEVADGTDWLEGIAREEFPSPTLAFLACVMAIKEALEEHTLLAQAIDEED
jgi:hypothetical protein